MPQLGTQLELARCPHPRQVIGNLLGKVGECHNVPLTSADQPAEVIELTSAPASISS